MRRFVRNAARFSVPALVYVAIVLALDPFDYFNLRSIVPDRVRISTANALNQCFLKMNEFRKHPVPNVLLGDSRMLELSADKIREATGREYFNFAYGGGSLKEMIDTFWFAAGETKLERVYIGLNLNVYNDYNNADRTATYKSIAANPLLYFVNRTVVHAAALDMYSMAARKDLKLGVPRMDREAFWQSQLGPLTDAYYSSFVYPHKYKSDLAKISAYCKRNGIQLTFVIFPTHVDLQNRIHDFHLEQAAADMRRDLASMGSLFDFDYENEITARKENFRDPYHYTESIGDHIIREVWLGPVQYARLTGRT